MTSTEAGSAHPAADGFVAFASPVGTCAVAWRGDALVATQLSEGTAASTRARMRARVGVPEVPPADAPPAVADAVRRIVAVLEGTDDDLRSVEVDLDAATDLERTVYRAARDVAPGSTTTYGEIARLAGGPGLARAVGRALGHNPLPLVVPCHRIVGAGGTLGGFSAATGPVLKLRLLSLEGRGPGLAVPYDVDAAVGHLRADPVLAAVVDRVGPPALRREPHPSTFAALVEAVVHEHAGATSGPTVHARLCVALPRPLDGPTPDALLGLADARFAGAGVPRAAARALRELAAHALFGDVPDDDELAALSDAEVVDLLTDVPGVGRGVVERVLVSRLGRLDVLLADDAEVRRGFELATGGRPAGPDALRSAAERWRPYRSLASWYLRRLAGADRAEP